MHKVLHPDDEYMITVLTNEVFMIPKELWGKIEVVYSTIGGPQNVLLRCVERCVVSPECFISGALDFARYVDDLKEFYAVRSELVEKYGIEES